MSLVRKNAPNFTAPAVVDGKRIEQSFSLDRYKGKQEVILFFYPKDFTPICHSEVSIFQEILPELKKRGVAVVGVSIDSVEVHMVWLTTPRDQNGAKGVTYPVVSDLTKTISYNYGVLDGDWEEDENGLLHFENGLSVANRGVFLIDKQGIVQHELINDIMLKRDVRSVLHVVDTFQSYTKTGETCAVE